ncbi:MAG: hypothetical protein ABI649_01635 [Gaiellaceae bacterium]
MTTRARPAAASLALHGPNLWFLALVASAPAALLVGRALPEHGPWLAFRLLAAAACVLLVPGAVLLRSFAWPRDLGVAVAGSFLLSLAVIFAALAFTFAVGSSLTLTAVLVGAVTLAALAPAALAAPVTTESSSLVAVLALVAAGCLFAAVVWWAHRTLAGDALFHLGRVRKLDELDSLPGLASVGEFRDGPLHAGYAFPLWHGALALVSRAAGVDSALVVLRLAAVLVPLALVVAYAAGASLFRSWAGGVATAAGQIVILGFSRDGTGIYESLSLPATLSWMVLPLAALAAVFAYVEEGRRRLLVLVGAGGLALAVIHPPYAAFLGLALLGFLAARVLLAKTDAGRIATALGAFLLPAGLFYAWLLPAVGAAASVTPTAAQRAADIQHYGGYVRGSGLSLRFAPKALSRGGPGVVAALAAVPFAFFAARRRWAAYVLGGSLAVLTVLLVPVFFSPLSDLASLSQSRRLAQFVPLPFALAGAAVLLGRFRALGVVAALGAGLGFELAYSADLGYQVGRGGPVWPVAVAFMGGALALAAGVFFRRAGPLPTTWTAAAALAFAVPIGVGGLSDVQRDPHDPDALTPGLVEAVRADVATDDVVFAPVQTAYRLVAYAPVYVAAAPVVHIGNLGDAPRRSADVRRFFDSDATDAEREKLLSAYDARWLVVDRRRAYPRDFVASLDPVYEDRRYALYRVGTP